MFSIIDFSLQGSLTWPCRDSGLEDILTNQWAVGKFVRRKRRDSLYIGEVHQRSSKKGSMHAWRAQVVMND